MVHDVSPAVIDGGPIKLGEFVRGETTVPGQLVRYAFDAEADQTVFFDHIQSSATIDFTLEAPDGRTEVFKYHADRGPLLLTQSGTYTFLADPRSDTVAIFEFMVHDVSPAVIDGGPIKLGEFVRGETTVPGQLVRYAFDAEADQTVFFDHIQSSATIDFTLEAPDGRTEVFKYHADRGPLLLTQSGTYTFWLTRVATRRRALNLHSRRKSSSILEEVLFDPLYLLFPNLPSLGYACPRCNSHDARADYQSWRVLNS